MPSASTFTPKTSAYKKWSVVGWTSSENGVAVQFGAGDTINISDLMNVLGLSASASVTLYPIWREPIIAITYEVNNASYGEVSVSFQEVGTISYTTPEGAVPSCTATKLSDADFLGWFYNGFNANAYATIDGYTIKPNIVSIAYNNLTAITFTATFTPSSSVLKYHGGYDGGVEVTDAILPPLVTIKDADGTRGLLSAKPSRSGSVFEGWYLDSAYTLAASDYGSGDPSYSELAAVQTPVNNTITLYAKWESVNVTYTVNWKRVDYLGTPVDLEDGNVVTYIYSESRTAPLNSTVFYTDADKTLESVPSGLHSSFIGYAFDENLSTHNALTLSDRNETYTIEVVFKERADYSVFYDLQGGTGGRLANGNVIADKTVNWFYYGFLASTDSVYVPTRVGYTFEGWFYQPAYDSEGVRITSESYTYANQQATATLTDKDSTRYSEFVNNDPNVMGVVIYAKWTEEEVTFTYQLQDSESGMLNRTSEKVLAITGTPEPKGATVTASSKWSFVRWARLDSSGRLTNVPEGWVEGTTLLPKKETVNDVERYVSVTFVAVLEKEGDPEPPAKKHYYVVFDANGPSSGIDKVEGTTGTNNTQELVEDTEANLDKCGYTRVGYRFGGWNTVANPTPSTPGMTFNDEASVLNLLGTDFVEGARLECLYAQWVENVASLLYTVSGKGSLDRSNETIGAVTGTPQGSIATPEIGYKFAGWTAKTGAEKANVISNASSPTIVLSKGDTGIWESASYLASFSPISYSVAYDANGGSGDTMASDAFSYEVRKQISANAYTRDGWAFKGWNTAANGSGETVAADYSASTLTTTDGATVTLFAQWEQGPDPVDKKTYTITFKANGPTEGRYKVEGVTSENNSQGMVEDTSSSLASCGFTRLGYDFAGWNTKADGTGTSYADKASVTNLLGTEFEEGALGVLYAQWKEIVATIRYAVEGAGTLDCTSEFIGCVTGSATGCVATPKTGYKFLGWTLEGEELKAASETLRAASAGNTIVDSKSEILQLNMGDAGIWSDATYVAHFGPISYNVAYDANGGAGAQMASGSFSYEVAKQISSNAYSRDGWTFKGWNTASDGSGDSVATTYDASKLSTTDGETVTLFAQWEQDETQEEEEKKSEQKQGEGEQQNESASESSTTTDKTAQKSNGTATNTSGNTSKSNESSETSNKALLASSSTSETPMTVSAQIAALSASQGKEGFTHGLAQTGDDQGFGLAALMLAMTACVFLFVGKKLQG